MTARIGVFGGTFNPTHLGHLILAQDAMEAFELTKVLFVPCAQPPHKDASRLAPAAHRAAMLAMAIAGNPDFEFCDVEIRRGGTNYSIDTVRHLQTIYPRHELFFIIGSDSLKELHLWKEIPELLGLCKFITLVRPGFAAGKSDIDAIKLQPTLRSRLAQNIVTAHQIDISSSDIRHRAAEGMSIRYLVPNSVESYIAEHNLYRT